MHWVTCQEHQTVATMQGFQLIHDRTIRWHSKIRSLDTVTNFAHMCTHLYIYTIKPHTSMHKYTHKYTVPCPTYLVCPTPNTGHGAFRNWKGQRTALANCHITSTHLHGLLTTVIPFTRGMYQGQELATSGKSKSCQMWRLLDWKTFHFWQLQGFAIIGKFYHQMPYECTAFHIW